MSRLVLGAAAAAVALAAAALAGAAGPPGGGGRIVFASNRAPNLTSDELVSVAPVTGARPVVLGEMPPGAVPDPTGTRIAFGSYDRGGRLVVAAPDGSSRRVVATSPYGLGEPVWSPDGRRIAFVITAPCIPDEIRCGNAQLWVVDANGSRLRKVAEHARHQSWSPDGRRLAYSGQYSYYEDWGVPWVAPVDGGGARRLSPHPLLGRIAWSPRGDRIAFPTREGVVRVAPLRGRGRAISRGADVAWSRDGRTLVVSTNESLWSMRPDGSARRRIADAPRGRGGVPLASFRDLAASPRRNEFAYLVDGLDGDVVAAIGADGRRGRTVFTADPRDVVEFFGWSSGGRRLLLSRTRRESRDFDLYSMRGDGSDVRRLTDDFEYEVNPAWSPDATRVAFEGITPGANATTSLYVIGADGTGRVRLTTPPSGSNDRGPAWAPDGRRVAFSRTLGQESSELFVVAPDGSSPTQVTSLGGANFQPAWSPEGTQLAFAHFEALAAHVFVARADGTGARQLEFLRSGTGPSWSPDGTRIAFLGSTVGNVVDLFTISADGTGIARIAADVDSTSAPTWSPDGSRIAFVGKDGDIHSVAATGGDDADLTRSAGADLDPNWSRLAGG